ncbi:Cna B-type domain-containing protein [Mycoplasma sp. P36-A1]|uniref:Cna B-type domain-containing protein n=1 Tax=Mycoplasma sp. P36-A1 TaxID=3252900 RepID=UPI003C2DA945
MENKSRYATKFYVVLMMLSLVSQLFVPVLQVAAVEVSTVVTEMTAKSTGENTTGENTAELNLSLNNTSSEKKSEQIKLDSDVLMIPGVLNTLVSTEGKNVGTYQIKNRQIDVEINENVSAQVNIPVTFSATDTAATATFTNGQLTANVDVAAKQNKTSSSSTSSSEEKVTTSTSTTSSTSITSKSEVSPKATTQDEQANDISSYLPDSSNGTIIDKADIKFTDPSNNEVSAADVTADTNVSLAYNWSIPNELKDGYSVKAGNYFEFKLPANITYRAGTGDLGDYGTYEIKSDGTVRFTFNSNVDDIENIKGTFNYNRAKINVTEPGQTTIIVPTTSGDQKVDIIANPTGGNDIAKSGTVSPAKNPQSVNWQVDINTNGRTLNNAVIKDTLPKGLKLTGTQVYLLNIDLKGNITGEGQQLTEKTDYTVSDNGTVTLIGNYSKTQQAFRIKYATDIEADAIPNEGGDVKFENNATLVNNGKDYPAQATVTASYGKLLDKKYEGASASGSQKLDWTINYNAGDKKLLAGTVLTDNLSGAQEYTGIPKLVYTDGPNSGQEVKQADYEITYNSDKTQMTIKFTSSLEQAVKITYQTQVNTPINGSTTIGNSAESNGKTVTVDGKKVVEQGIVKSLGAVDYNAKTVIWNVRINQGQQEMTNWSAEDTIPDGLTLVDDESFVLKDVTTNKALVRGTDYHFTKTDTGFEIELSGAYKTTSDEFLLTYKTNFDTKKLIGNKWTNKIVATWTDKNGDAHLNNGQADFKPKEEFVTDGTKSGSYNAVNKHITWTVVANYNQRELKNGKLVDTLTGDPEYVTDSAKLYEATINLNGSYTLGKQVDTNIDYDKDSRTLTANLPENSNKAYVMIFETSLEGKVIDAPSYDNTAKYTNDGQDKDLTAKVSVPNSGKVAYKTGEQDPEDSAYAVWNITVNPEQSTLKDVTVVDKPSTNQVLDKSDVIVYGTKIATNGAITVDKDSVLTEGKDYSIDITTDQTSGEQVMTIKFLHEISTSYSVHYRTLINSSKINDTLRNTVTVTGTGEKVVTGEVTTSHDVVNNSGTAEGTNLDYQLTKVDKDTDKVLSGVKFELWSYKNNAKGQLLRTGTTDDKGQIRWNNLKSGKYVLVETAPTDYQTVTDRIITLKAADTNSDKLVISTIANEKVKTSVSGEKTWVDNNDQDGVRPDKITVNLLADGKKVDSKTVTAKDGWKYEFNDLDKFKAGQEIKYTVSEAAVDGYKTTYDGNNIVNTHQVSKTSVSGQKTWSDHDNQDGVRPDEITVNLLADGKKVDSKTVTAKDGWKYEFNDLDKFKAGQEIKYTVAEAAVDGYKTTYDGNNIVNTHQVAKTSVSGQKTWLDNNDQDGNRPDSITLHLLANGKEVATKTVTAKDNWKYEFNDLDKFKAGQEIKYSISEDKVTGYKTTVSGYDLTNILNESSIPVKNQSINQGTPKNHKHQGLLESILPATGVLSSKNFVISGLVFILFVLSSLGYVFIKRRHND